MRVLIFVLFTFVITQQFVAQSTIYKSIDPVFRNLSWVMDEKCGEILTHVSQEFRDESLLNDTNWVTEERYNLYYDSLSLWYVTNSKDNVVGYNSTEDGIISGEFSSTKEKLSTQDWLMRYRLGTKSLYLKNDKKTESLYCIPSSYQNVKWFYETESDKIKEYNDGRIISYEYVLKDHGFREMEVHILLYFHETIEPVGTAGQQAFRTPWTPRRYYYAKPQKVVYKTSIDKIWESKTGLPFSLTKELNISEDRVLNILNHFVLLPTENKTEHDQFTHKIYVNCDTCDVKLFDSQQEDGDIIDFVYLSDSIRVQVKNKGIEYKIILKDSGIFALESVSQGRVGLCTVDAIINDQKHVFGLKEKEKILIELIKR